MKTMTTPAILAVLSLLSLHLSAGEVYRCEGPEGPEFSTTPCSNDSEPLDLRNTPPGGQIAHPLPSHSPRLGDTKKEQTPESGEEEASPCKNFTSTEFRTLRIGERVEKGMTREQVETVWGPPVDRVEGAREVWTYDNRYYGRVVSLRQVYFRDGCVEGIKTGVTP